MTIAIRVTNEDTRETAVVKVECIDPTSGAVNVYGKTAELKGKESETFYVHSGESLRVREIQNG